MKNMKDYPQLAKMGVRHPKHIAHYAVNSIGHVDVLRIVYERPTGSLRPQTRTYKFPRVQKEADVNRDGKPEDIMVSNPDFRRAVEELEQLLAKKGKIKDVSGEIIEELRLLEEDIALRSECIKMLLKKMPVA